MNHWIHPDAEAELGDAAVHYLTHASYLIAEAFLTEYERLVDLLVANQRWGQRLEGGLRICHFERFPYSLIYAEDPVHGSQIFAVAHHRRDPSYWRTRSTEG